MSEWLATRFAPGRFGPLALLHALAAGWRSPRSLATVALVAWLALLALRLLHDLLTHARALERAGCATRARLLGVASALASLGLAPCPGPWLLGLLLAVVGRRRPGLGLLKYAALVLALADPRAPAPLMAALTVYLSFLVHERLHDPPAGPSPPLLEVCLLGGLPLVWGALLTALAATAALAPLLYLHRARRAPGRWCEVPFLLGLLEVLSCPPP